MVGEHAQSGFNAGDGVNFYILNGSFTQDIVKIQNLSNVNISGKFIFRIDGSEIVQDGCQSGWTGSNCSKFECFYGCLNGGLCIGPNQCQCTNEWKGSECEIPVCAHTCDTRGKCIAPNTCECYSQYSGINCEFCANNTWGDGCYFCPICLNGKCNKTTGKCDCVSENWTGDYCDKCSYAFYGPYCLPETKVLDVSPNSISVTNETVLIRVKGHNFHSNETYFCIFNDDLNSPVTFKSRELLVCSIDPTKLTLGYVDFKIKIKTTETIISYNYQLLLYKNCSFDCGQSSSPLRGYCKFGVCNCVSTWKGDNCDIQILKPIFKTINDININEFSNFYLALEFISGTEPISIRKQESPQFLQTINTTYYYWADVYQSN